MNCPIINQRCVFYVLVHLYAKCKEKLLVNSFTFVFEGVYMSQLDTLVRTNLRDKLRISDYTLTRKFKYEIEIVDFNTIGD